MPRKYYKKKRTYRRKRKPRRYTLSTGMGSPSGLSNQRTAKLRYVDIIAMTSTTGSLGSHVFRANSLFDPDLSGVGHQPMGFDFWALMYNHYVVLGSKITAKVIDSSTSNSSPGFVGIFLDDDSTLPYSTPMGFIEAGKGTWRAVQGGQTRALTCTSRYSAKKFFNIKDVKDNQTRLGATMVANPSESADYQVWYSTADATTNVISAMITIEYIVSFSEPKAQNQS